MKKLALTFLLLSITAPIFAKEISTQEVFLDSEKTQLKGFNIEDNNYYKLRDVAALLKDSKIGFNVSYNEQKKRIEVTRDSKYVTLKDDLAQISKSVNEPSLSKQKLYIDGEPYGIKAYTIDGYNYMKLRDLGKTIGFAVDYDKDNNRVLIESRKIEGTQLANNVIDIKPTSLAFSKQPQNLKYQDKITLDKILEGIDSIVMGSQTEGQVSAKAEYDEPENTVYVRPIMNKYSGSLKFTPILSIEQSERKVDIKPAHELNLAKLLKDHGFDKTKPFKLNVGYNLSEDSDYRFVTVVNFK